MISGASGEQSCLVVKASKQKYFKKVIIDMINFQSNDKNQTRQLEWQIHHSYIIVQISIEQCCMFGIAEIV